MLFDSLSQSATVLERDALEDVSSITDWPRWSRRVRGQWLDTLGIDDEHLACDLDPRVTGRHDLGDVVVENVHFQVAPGARIPANLWLPRQSSDRPRPCIIYLCGHTLSGKWWYQYHGRWFARRGYPCLMLDAIQIGESEGVHHGTFYFKRWHWTSLGYSPAAVEVQAARRALDYLATRPETDATRCGLTGISGGATMSLFTAAADERFAAVAPHCIAGTVEQLIGDRSLDGHCDCATWVNRHRLGMTHLAALLAPRPLLLSFSTLDALCTPQPMRDLVKALQPLWARLGKPEQIAASEDEIPHAYSEPITRRILHWMNLHLRGDDTPIADDERMPFQSRHVPTRQPVAPTSLLCAFSDPNNPPRQQRMAEIDRTFIGAPGRPPLPTDAEAWAPVRDARLAALRDITFRDTTSVALVRATWTSLGSVAGRLVQHARFEADRALTLSMTLATPANAAPNDASAPIAHLIGACDPATPRARGADACGIQGLGQGTVHVRGSAQTAIGPGAEWFIRRAYPLLGQSLPERQTMDLLRGLELARQQPTVGRVALFGRGAMAAVAIYAALLGEADELVLQDAPGTHWDGGPEFPGVLRVGDLAENLALFFPRPITFVGEMAMQFDWVVSLYAECGKRDAIRTVASVSEVAFRA